MAVTSSISDLQKQAEQYKVSASYDFEKNEFETTKVTGDRTGGLFAKAQEGMGKMEFLRLLTAQLQYQDPLSPMENTEFVAQLAQFSQLEATSNMQQSMQEMATIFGDSIDLQTFNSQSMTNASSVSLVGKEVRLRQNMFEYSGSGDTMTFKAHLGEKSSGMVKIVDGDGNTVRSIKLENKDDTNAVEFVWNGKDETGKQMPADTYNLVIEGQETNNSLYCFVEDYVTGVRFDSKGTMIRVSGIDLPIGNILEVNNPSGASTNGGLSGMTMQQAMALVGYEVKTSVDKISYSPPSLKKNETTGKDEIDGIVNDKVEFNLDLGGSAEATILIRDANGNIVDRQVITQDDVTKNNGKFQWEKTSFNGSSSYTIEIDSGNRNAFFYQRGTISGVLNQNGVPKLRVGSSTIDIAKILEISEPVKKDPVVYNEELNKIISQLGDMTA